MTIIQRYLTREVLKQFVIVLVAVIGIYVIVDFFEKSDNFVKAGLPALRTLTFFALNIPFVAAQIVPVGLLLSVIIVFSMMNRNNELMALRSGGVSLYSLLKPMLVLGLVATAGLFFFSDQVVPVTTVKANTIWTKEVKKKNLISSREKNIWIKGRRRITHIAYYDPAKRRAYGLSVNYFDDRFRLIRKIDAEKGVFENGSWHLHKLIEQIRVGPAGSEPSDTFQISYVEKMNRQLDFTPEDLAKVVRKPEEMSYKELSAYISKVEDEGYDATVHRVNLHAKVSYAFVCVIMCLIGMGLSVRQGAGKGIFFNVTYGIALAFFYWVAHSFCLSLGYGEMLPPLVAAWVANFIFMILGFLILVYAE
ncbi:MAG: LPS export ABC transporter permease LptG [Deltaproteobacteria bacterium]|nr:LPS export ABC transporter permease LptG [Deltaproteobacteria bacterium]